MDDSLHEAPFGAYCGYAGRDDAHLELPPDNLFDDRRGALLLYREWLVSLDFQVLALDLHHLWPSILDEVRGGRVHLRAAEDSSICLACRVWERVGRRVHLVLRTSQAVTRSDCDASEKPTHS